MENKLFFYFLLYLLFNLLLLRGGASWLVSGLFIVIFGPFCLFFSQIRVSFVHLLLSECFRLRARSPLHFVAFWVQ